MNSVISAEQARKITGGRTPLVPVEYEQAVKALQACLTLDEARYWSNKADALAAWAKIWHNDQAGAESKRLKLHAYRRMGELAYELRPNLGTGGQRNRNGHKGTVPGAPSLLIDNGLTKASATAAVKLARMSSKEFQQLIGGPRPPAPLVVLTQRRGGSESWKLMVYQPGANIARCRTFCRGHDPKKLALGLLDDEVRKARDMVVEIAEWLDAFEQALPKTPATPKAPK